MVYYGGTNRARYISSIVNQNQGGGDKKAGFPYIIGRDSWSSIFIGSTDPATGNCAKLSCYQVTMTPWTVQPSRGIGNDMRIPIR